MSLDELDACPRPQEDMKDLSTPSSGSQSNDRATHLIFSHPRSKYMSPPNLDEPNRTRPECNPCSREARLKQQVKLTRD